MLSWAAPPSWAGDGRGTVVGRGNFLIKVGGWPGIPVHLEPTETGVGMETKQYSKSSLRRSRNWRLYSRVSVRYCKPDAQLEAVVRT